jgi:hypothetical protein
VGAVVQPPSALVARAHNGDVQWYLYFAIGSILFLLLHFLA